MLGVGVSFLRERLDDRFRGEDDIEKALQVPLLAHIPPFKAGTSGISPMLHDPQGFASEAYRTLRTNIQFLTSQRGIRSFVVTSASAGEGKTTTVANLATTLAQVGKRVVLVSADLRRPSLRATLGLPKEQEGLSTWLADPTIDIGSLIMDPGIANLRLLPAGPIPPNPSELLNSPRLLDLITLLENSADFVIFDSPPTVGLADAPVLASRVGGALLVIDAQNTHRSAVLQAKKSLTAVGGELLGSVLNNFDQANSSYYYSSYSAYAYKPAADSNGSSKREGTNGHKRRRRLSSKK
jgi:capsular exopolysaccharide synthesis family protein